MSLFGASSTLPPYLPPPGFPNAPTAPAPVSPQGFIPDPSSLGYGAGVGGQAGADLGSRLGGSGTVNWGQAAGAQGSNSPTEANQPCAPASDCQGCPDWVTSLECKAQQLFDIGLWNVGLLVLAGFGLYLALRPEIDRAVKTAVRV